MKTIVTIFLIVIFSIIYALPLSLSYEGNELDSIDFGEIEINETHFIQIYIKNIFSEEQIVSVSSFFTDISLSDSLFVIAAEDSVSLDISFSGGTNIHYQTALIFTNQHDHVPIYMPFSARAYLPNNEFPSTFNLFDNDLKKELFRLVNNHTELSYLNARQWMFGTIDNVDGFVECIYTGILVETDGIPNGNIMNTEHIWPQSMGASIRPAQSDLYILSPCNSLANTIRSNLPFGVVYGTPTWENGGSKRGFGIQGLPVFEPRDARKGDVARAMFYFAINYENPFSPFFDNQESILKNWNRDFAVTEREHNRNLAIMDLQQKKNPFITHPPFADRIYSISTNEDTPESKELIYPSLIIFIETGIIKIPLFNKGNTDIVINNVLKSSQNIEVLNYPERINSSEIGHIEIFMIQSLEDFYEITIHSDMGTYHIVLKNSNVDIVDETIPRVDGFEILVYPNPARGEFFIQFLEPLTVKTPITDSYLMIYNLRGQRIHIELLNTTQYDFTTIRTQSIQFNMPENISSGIYFITIKNDEIISRQRFIYIK
ncbi:MAG: endonuclease [Candidatus Cloacimonetes bacterium]|nr:endonuclease [Candidatus Cloacimonadota bacterium]